VPLQVAHEQLKAEQRRSAELGAARAVAEARVSHLLSAGRLSVAADRSEAERAARSGAGGAGTAPGAVAAFAEREEVLNVHGLLHQAEGRVEEQRRAKEVRAAVALGPMLCLFVCNFVVGTGCVHLDRCEQHVPSRLRWLRM
jgi:hypothetical protein